MCSSSMSIGQDHWPRLFLYQLCRRHGFMACTNLLNTTEAVLAVPFTENCYPKLSFHKQKFLAILKIAGK